MIFIEGLLEDEQGLSMGDMLTVKFCQPSHEFTFGVDMSFILYPLVLNPWCNKFIRACRFWSLVFMQGFDVESKTFGISSSSTLWQGPASPVQVMQWSKLDYKKPRDQTREDDKLRGPIQKSVESCGTRSYVQLGEKLMTRAHMQKGEGSRRLENRRHPKEAGNQAGVGPGRSAQPITGPRGLPLWPSHHSGYL
jgi:hypothetical protein